MKRRTALLALAGAVAFPARAHTPYGQWVIYRRKHLLIGCHREDPTTYKLAQALVAELAHALPEAKARIARARRPERLASLIGTDQLEVAILDLRDAEAIAAGRDRFAPYGAVDLTVLGVIQNRLLIADAAFPERHAWQVAAALHEGTLVGPEQDYGALRMHAGAMLWKAGAPPPVDG